jgi:hypothetical protein
MSKRPHWAFIHPFQILRPWHRQYTIFVRGLTYGNK